MCSIPVVDFGPCCNEDSSFDANMTMGLKLVDILSKTGFVYLRNFGISSNEIDKVNEVTKLFFESPLELKKQYAKNKAVFGYVGVQEEKLDISKYPGYKEVFNISGCFLNAIESDQWPDTLSPEFSTTVKAFMHKCKALALNILDILAIGLKLDKDFFRKCHSLIHKDGNYTALRSLYYPPLPENLNQIQTRLGEHSDYGSITLLFQDNIGGLQVQCANGHYVEASPIQDTVLVNIGDALQYWTKGKLKSTNHKVEIPADVQKRKSVRRSIAYFVLPDNHVRLDQDFESQSIGLNCDLNKASSDPITFLRYLENKLTNSFDKPQKL